MDFFAVGTAKANKGLDMSGDGDKCMSRHMALAAVIVGIVTVITGSLVGYAIGQMNDQDERIRKLEQSNAGIAAKLDGQEALLREIRADVRKLSQRP